MRAGELEQNLDYADRELCPETFVLSGGEPLLHPNIDLILKKISYFRHTANFHLHTNATMLTEWKLELLQSIPMIKTGTVGFPSHDPTVYGDICGRKNDFYKARKGINLLHKAGFHLRATVIICHHNVNELEPTVQFLLDEGFAIIEIRIPFEGPDCNLHDLFPDARETDKVLDRIMERYSEDERVRVNASAALCFGTRMIEPGLGQYRFIDLIHQFSNNADTQMQISSIWEKTFASYRKEEACADCLVEPMCQGFSPLEISKGYARFKPYSLQEFGFIK